MLDRLHDIALEEKRADLRAAGYVSLQATGPTKSFAGPEHWPRLRVWVGVKGTEAWVPEWLRVLMSIGWRSPTREPTWFRSWIRRFEKDPALAVAFLSAEALGGLEGAFSFLVGLDSKARVAPVRSGERMEKKRCMCGRSFSVDEFRALPQARGGLYTKNVYRDVDPPEVEFMEWRNCPCGSTIVIQIAETEMKGEPVV